MSRISIIDIGDLRDARPLIDRLQHSCFLIHGTKEVIDDAQDPFEKVDCINTYGSYNRTCKGDYVRPFQPCKDELNQN